MYTGMLYTGPKEPVNVKKPIPQQSQVPAWAQAKANQYTGVIPGIGNKPAPTQPAQQAQPEQPAETPKPVQLTKGTDIVNQWKNSLSTVSPEDKDMLYNQAMEELATKGITNLDADLDPAKVKLLQQTLGKYGANYILKKKPTQKSTQTSNNGLSAEQQAAFSRLKQKKGTDADLAMFASYSEDELKKMGFGPVSIQAIKGAKPTAKPATKPETKPASVQPKSKSTNADDWIKSEPDLLKDLTNQFDGNVEQAKAFMREMYDSKPQSKNDLRKIQAKHAGNVGKKFQDAGGELDLSGDMRGDGSVYRSILQHYGKTANGSYAPNPMDLMR